MIIINIFLFCAAVSMNVNSCTSVDQISSSPHKSNDISKHIKFNRNSLIDGNDNENIKDRNDDLNRIEQSWNKYESNRGKNKNNRNRYKRNQNSFIIEDNAEYKNESIKDKNSFIKANSKNEYQTQ